MSEVGYLCPQPTLQAHGSNLILDNLYFYSKIRGGNTLSKYIHSRIYTLFYNILK